MLIPKDMLEAPLVLAQALVGVGIVPTVVPLLSTSVVVEAMVVMVDKGEVAALIPQVALHMAL
jgi:F0F1-type ATP synthase beta subunit